jgi:hypothetical protein
MTIDPNDLALQALVERAAERGAEQALARVGLSDPDSANDIRELRSLLESWRTARRSALAAMVKWLTIALLGVLVAGMAVKAKLFGG